MVNTKGQLAGFSDPSVPGWQDRLKDRVAARHAEAMRTERRTPSPLRAVNLNVRQSIEFAAALRDAAHARGMSPAAYARRSIAAFVAHDSGRPLADLLATLPAVQPPTQNRLFAAGTPDDGHGHGQWTITGLT